MEENIDVKVCCDIVIEKNRRILMGKRGNVFGKGSWALPGGHLKVGEKTKDCVIRELDEEVGIFPLEANLIGVVNDTPDIPGQTNHYVRFVYYVTKFSGEVINRKPDRCDGWEWFEKTNLPQPIFVGHIKVIKLFSAKKREFFFE